MLAKFIGQKESAPALDAKILDARVLDVRGLFCPEPVMLLHHLLQSMPPGELVRILATDPSTQRDIPRFCNFLGHQLLESQVEDGQGVFTYLIGKSEPSDS